MPPEGPLPASEVEAQLNIVESALSSATGTDEFLSAILEAQRAQLQALRQEGAMLGSVGNDDIPEGGIFSVPSRSALPEDAVGTIARDIQPNASGPGVFRISGTTFYAVVKNDDDDPLQAGQSVRVIGPRNRVTARDAAGGYGAIQSATQPGVFRFQGNLFRIPEVVTRDQDVKVSNQKYIRGTYQDVSGGLNPGETKEVARIEPDNDQLFLLKYTNATAHNTVRYRYTIDGPNPDQDLSGTMPWATPPDLHEVIPDGWNIVEDYVSLEFVEESGSNSYSTIQGTLTGLLIDV